MKIKKMRTKKAKMLLRIDIIIIIICLIVTNYKLYSEIGRGILGTTEFYFNMFKELNIFLGIIITLFSMIYQIIIDNFWLLLIYLIVRFTRLKKIKQNSMYEVIDNIDYFRNTFRNLSPAEISIIADLEVEKSKDISATILSLYYKKIIDFQDDKIIVIGDNNDLKNTEREVLNSLKAGEIAIDTLKWKDIAIKETMAGGYIKKAEKKKIKLKFSSLLFVLAIFMVVHAAIQISNYDISKIDYYVEKEAERNEKYLGEDYENLSNEELVEKLLDNPEIFKELLEDLKYVIDIVSIVIRFLIGGALIIIIPIYKITRKVSYELIVNSNSFERTRKGKILVEQIAAMKNFIHDFGNFSDKTKEQVKLWDEFLIYAVILEENNEIIDSICAFKNVKIFF